MAHRRHDPTRPAVGRRPGVASVCVAVLVAALWPPSVAGFDAADLPAQYTMVYAWTDSHGVLHSDTAARWQAGGQEAFSVDVGDGPGPPETRIRRRDEYAAIGLEVYSPRDRILFTRASGTSSYLDLERRLLVVLAARFGEGARVFRPWALLNPRLIDPLAGRL